MNTAGNGGRLIREQVIMQTSCWASTIENNWLSDAESTVLIKILLMTKVLTPVDAEVAAFATLLSGEPSLICLGICLIKSIGSSIVAPDCETNCFMSLITIATESMS